MENNFQEQVNLNQPIQQMSSQESPLPKKNFPKKIFWIFFIVSILIAFAAGGFFFGAKQNVSLSQNKQKIVPTIAQISPTSLPTEISAKVNDPTANWKTYVNTKIGFQIRYPKNWLESEPVSDKDNTLVYVNSNESFGAGPEPLKYYVYVAEENSLPAVSFVKQVVGNYTFYKTKDLPSRSGALSAFVEDNNKKYISISLAPYDERQPFESQDKYITIFDQILSTFKFTN